MSAEQASAGERAGRRGPTTVARAYFEAIGNHDVEAATAMWRPGGIDRLVGIADLRVPDELRAWFGGLFRAIPDFSFEVISVTAQKERAAVRWIARGTFNGDRRFEGIEPTGATIEIEGCDVLEVRDGEIVANHAYMNATELARQLGAMPPQGSVAERGMLAAVNAKTAAGGLLERLRSR